MELATGTLTIPDPPSARWRAGRDLTRLLSLLALAVGGCWGGEDARLIPVAGTVTYAGRPLTTGTVSFRPDAARGNHSLHHPTGAIDAQGRYELFTAGKPGAPPGAYKIVVFASEQVRPTASVHPGLPKSLIPPRYNDPADTPLTIEVLANSADGAYDLRLEK